MLTIENMASQEKRENKILQSGLLIGMIIGTGALSVVGMSRGLMADGLAFGAFGLCAVLILILVFVQSQKV
jgi:hypothetical protein